MMIVYRNYDPNGGRGGSLQWPEAHLNGGYYYHLGMGVEHQQQTKVYGLAHIL